MWRKQLVRLLRVMILAPSHPRADTSDHPPAPPRSRARLYTRSRGAERVLVLVV